MTKFSKLLSEIIKNNEDLKVYHIAKIINCDRTWLQKIMTGERKINYETILPLCSFLRNYISDSFVSELYESFAEEYFGSKRYETVLFIKDRLQEMQKKEGYIHHLAEKKDFDMQYFISQARKIYEIGRDMEALLWKVFSLIEEEKNIAAQQSREIRCYVHISVKWAAVKDLFLFTLNDETNSGNIDFRCLFDENGDEVGKGMRGCKKENARMEAFLSACEYAIYQMKVYDIGSKEASFFQAALFPYYVITGRGVLLISGNGELFFRINEEETVEKFGRYFLRKMKEESFFWEDRELGYEEMVELAEAKQSYVLADNFWKGVFEPQKTLEKVTKEYIIQRETAAAIEDFCKPQKELFVIVSAEGLEEKFKENRSKFKEKQMKLKALEQLYEEYKRDKSKKIYFLNTKKYRLHSRFHIWLATDRIIEFAVEKSKNLLGGG